MGPQTTRTQPTSAIRPRENSDPLLSVTTGQGRTPTMKSHLDLYHSAIASVVDPSQRLAQSAPSQTAGSTPAGALALLTPPSLAKVARAVRSGPQRPALPTPGLSAWRGAAATIPDRARSACCWGAAEEPRDDRATRLSSHVVEGNAKHDLDRPQIGQDPRALTELMHPKLARAPGICGPSG